MAIIPDAWLTSDKQKCFWPIYLKNDAAIQKAVFNGASVIMEKSVTCLIRIKYKTDDYQKAKNKMMLLENTSNVSSDDDSAHRRPRKKNLQLEDFIADYSEDDLSEISPVPKLFSSINRIVELQSDCESARSTPSLRRENNKYGGLTTNVNDCSTPSTTRSFPPRNNNVDAPMNANRIMDLLEKILKTQEELKAQMRHVVQLIAQQTNNNAVELKKLNLSLESQETFNKSVNILHSIGGKDVTNTCRRILSKLVGNEVAMSMKWSGRNGREPFGALKHIVDLLLVAVRKNPLCCNATKKDVEDCAKVWLRNAGDRDGGRSRRTNNKNTGSNTNNR
ncbi:uncharacterized protein LOC116160029 isoform X3 [Photinus pyralis]|uniref:uncharacterized protein LOC116160029 isoform X3 n=1 Tax=Photinus pyralis TaxID=7054 RepID=UPI0012670420|nr:uncharacterized protein LOC116160029 isoform X3 [Photinus pyralis]